MVLRVFPCRPIDGMGRRSRSPLHGSAYNQQNKTVNYQRYGCWHRPKTAHAVTWNYTGADTGFSEGGGVMATRGGGVWSGVIAPVGEQLLFNHKIFSYKGGGADHPYHPPPPPCIRHCYTFWFMCILTARPQRPWSDITKRLLTSYWSIYSVAHAMWVHLGLGIRKTAPPSD